MILETKRLLLRPWTLDDAKDLYEYAKDPNVGPIAGWPVHTSVENSKEIIQHVLAVEDTFAVVLKETGNVVGSIGLMRKDASNIPISDKEGEIGYWIGVPFWGQGFIPEAVKELQRYAFEDLQFDGLWCGYYDGNVKSKRVQEKCGFQYKYTIEKEEVPLLHEVRTTHISYLSKEDWNSQQ